MTTSTERQISAALEAWGDVPCDSLGRPRARRGAMRAALEAAERAANPPQRVYWYQNGHFCWADVVWDDPGRPKVQGSGSWAAAPPTAEGATECP